MRRTLTPDPFKNVLHLKYEYNVIYNKKSKMLTIEEIRYLFYPRKVKEYKHVFKYSNTQEDEYYDLTFMDCIYKIHSDTHTEFHKYTYYL